ncbi:amidohydrolase family protein [Streptomyces sp. NPDC002054]|uniref:amidohydrolase family protein n=1 Tax=Streptomyces sp. NPDC002054 TaxID=3154663 RepID=UPI00331CB0AF
MGATSETRSSSRSGPSSTRGRRWSSSTPPRFYFDTAFCAGPASLPSLLAFAAPGHVLYGSDFPMVPEEWCGGFDEGLDGYPHWTDGQLHAIHRGNAERLFPRLAGTASRPG